MPRGVSNTLDYMHVELLYYIEMAALYQKSTWRGTDETPHNPISQVLTTKQVGY